MRLITSLMPFAAEIETQQAAVESWLSLGYKPFSVNSQAEISVLKPQFPRVQFMKIHDTMPPRLISLVCLIPNNDVAGIINSDIVLKLPVYYAKQAEEKLLFGQRINVETPDSVEGEFFPSGFDFFFFHGKWKLKLDNTYFRFGRPAWDYYLPWRLRQYTEAVLLKTPVAFHKIHQKRWNHAHYRSYCSSFVTLSHQSTNSTLKMLLTESTSCCMETLVNVCAKR